MSIKYSQIHKFPFKNEIFFSTVYKCPWNFFKNLSAWLPFKIGQALRREENLEFLEGQFCKEKPSFPN